MSGTPAHALVLLSGGLDSTLAARLLLDQGLRVTAVNFVGPFCTCSPRGAGCHLAGQVARQLGIELVVLTKGQAYLEVLRAPRHGTGRGINPCIDCRIYMLRRVRRLLDERGADFVVTGEVLGQRPMSQHRRALDLIERESGLAGILLRPLSAGVLEPTLPERQGLVDRQRLLDLQGRSRRPQLELARSTGIDVVSCGSGGCLLTDPAVAARLRDLFAHGRGRTLAEARLATCGRHFRLHAGLKVIVGRNQDECRRLEELAPADWPRAEFREVTGPLAIVQGKLLPDDRQVLARLLRAYTPHARGRCLLEIRSPDHRELVPNLQPAVAGELADWRIEPPPPAAAKTRCAHA